MKLKSNRNIFFFLTCLLLVVSCNIIKKHKTTSSNAGPGPTSDPNNDPNYLNGGGTAEQPLPPLSATDQIMNSITGQWVSNCVATSNNQYMFQISNRDSNTNTTNTFYFADSNCNTLPILTSTNIINYTIDTTGIDPNNAFANPIKLTNTLLTDVIAYQIGFGDANANEVFLPTYPALNTPTLKAGTISYDIIKIDNYGNLLFGLKTTTLTGFSGATRPTSIDPSLVFSTAEIYYADGSDYYSSLTGPWADGNHLYINITDATPITVEIDSNASCTTLANGTTCSNPTVDPWIVTTTLTFDSNPFLLQLNNFIFQSYVKAHYTTVMLAPTSPDGVTILNNIKPCGNTTWAIGTAVDLIKACTQVQYEALRISDNFKNNIMPFYGPITPLFFQINSSLDALNNINFIKMDPTSTGTGGFPINLNYFIGNNTTTN